MNSRASTANLKFSIFPGTGRVIVCALLALICWQFPLPRVFAQNDTNVLPALAPAYPEIPPTFWQKQREIAKEHSIATSIIVSFLSAFVTTLLWPILKPKPVPPPPPETVAREALAKLVGREEDGNVLSEVSQILRRYIAATLGLPEGERTTTEFYGVLAQAKDVDLALGKELGQFLRECDARKFAVAKPTDSLHAVARALEFVKRFENLKRATQPIPGR